MYKLVSGTNTCTIIIRDRHFSISSAEKLREWHRYHKNATCQEAYVKDHPVQSILVVFSPPQSRRGLLAFQHTFKDLPISSVIQTTPATNQSSFLTAR
jgi:hypothetical protein